MKIILGATTSWNHYNSRMSLARALKNHGHDVILLSPHDEFTQFLMKEGFRWVDFHLKPRGKNIFQELASIIFLINFYRREKPDVVSHFTPKGVIYGSFAANIAGLHSVFNTITGLGYVFSGKSNKRLKALVIMLYRIALKNTTVIFQNPDDFKYFCEEGIIDRQNGFLVHGSGIDIEKFKMVPETEETPIILLPSRFVEEKGIRYFVEASRILKSRQKKVRLVLVGRPEEDQPSSIPHAEITHWVNEGIIEWWGWHNDMEEIYPLAHIICLPTYYMEGIPKSLLEAASCGRALIATNVPGCREIVQHGENGLLIQPQNAVALAEAISQLVEDKELREKMGARSREIVAEKFSTEKVNARYFEIYKISMQG